jgi:hypothetical protein
MNTAPVPFIQVDPKSRQLVVSPEGRKVLSSIKGTVGVCAVAGVYRTGMPWPTRGTRMPRSARTACRAAGARWRRVLAAVLAAAAPHPDARRRPPPAGKSYILNQLAGKDTGFGVGSSVQACTKGIWLWGAPIQNKTSAPGAPEYVLLLDTEGLQSLSQTEGHDAKIFCLAILLSSFFIYNSEKASAAPAPHVKNRTPRCAQNGTTGHLRLEIERPGGARIEGPAGIGQ